ncbi:MAG: hypothetical protein R3Y09_06860 [Clostridia bacterium]
MIYVYTEVRSPRQHQTITATTSSKCKTALQKLTLKLQLYQQNKDIFVDDKKVSFLTKHKRRVQWINDHISDVILDFELEQKKWKVRKQFIVNEMMVSAEFLNKDKDFITLNDLLNL